MSIRMSCIRCDKVTVFKTIDECPDALVGCRHCTVRPGRKFKIGQEVVTELADLDHGGNVRENRTCTGTWRGIRDGMALVEFDQSVLPYCHQDPEHGATKVVEFESDESIRPLHDETRPAYILKGMDQTDFKENLYWNGHGITRTRAGAAKFGNLRTAEDWVEKMAAMGDSSWIVERV